VNIADRATYLAELVDRMRQSEPNGVVSIVCHGHSVPAGYSATPLVATFDAYPHLLHRGLKERFPFAVLNVIVTAIGGENSAGGAARFEADALCHRPEVVTIDYALNDRGIGLAEAEKNWRAMIEAALARGAKVILMTPTADLREAGTALKEHAEQIRTLAGEYEVGLADSLAAFEAYAAGPQAALSDLMSWVNHPNRAGHELVARELMRWFPIRYA